MASFTFFSNNGLLVSRERLRVLDGKCQSLGRHGSVSYSSSHFPLLGFHNCSKSQHRLLCNAKIRSLINKNSEDKETHLGRRENIGPRKRFSLRLRPRLRLLSVRLKRVWIRSSLNDLGLFLRKNVKRVTISTSISVALGLCYLFLKLTAMPSPKVVPYSDLITSLQNGSVTKVLFEEGSRRIYYNTNLYSVAKTPITEDETVVSNDQDGNMVDSVASGDVVSKQVPTGSNVFRKLMRSRASNPLWEYSTRKIDHDESYLLTLMREKGTIYSSAPQSVFRAIRSILITVLSLWIPLTPLMWLLYRQLSAANSPARKRRSSNQIVGFDDVEGVDAAKVELMEIVSCLQGAINYNKLGAKLPRGVLLVGPPGTGKTLLARAVAGEAGVPFFTVSASEFVELFVGRGAARIRDLFNVARKSSPSIVFIDELDAVGGKRGRSFNDERDQTLNQLLTEMDGFDSEMKVVVIAATNRPEALDPALCRPGRFSRKVFVGEPDEIGRRKILAVHLRGVPLDEDSDLICRLVASLTPGFVGADLANIINEAALLAARRGGESVSREDIMEAIERAKYGINDREPMSSTLSKELGKLFPWMPSLMGRNDTRQDGMQNPLGYQTLS
ncbi:Inactive ATP-dependent zinc metalloprotease FTSHI 3 like [Actinidia chinensis var. chinensis]|uniref:Inactive ATP-dependent zinc metalloprotease FTSHI 3 like n=1 Tax=Actinidia chinensis var. chinensis TaxID=1590841 RepID=A0A2R6RYG9_ACTCC|nr:Inactive ATP-dependent zinc metalloprotease FTSHI 3 like [Actinidia chinensis var. chinensis]